MTVERAMSPAGTEPEQPPLLELLLPELLLLPPPPPLLLLLPPLLPPPLLLLLPPPLPPLLPPLLPPPPPAAYDASCASEPLNLSRSTWLDMPGTLPVAEYCQKLHADHAEGSVGQLTCQLATQRPSDSVLPPTDDQNPGDT